MYRLKAAALATTLVILMLLAVPGMAHAARVVERVSVSSSGTQGNGQSGMSSISEYGRFVAFESGASNLVTGDTNGVFDVFLRDRQTGDTTRVSVTSGGVEGNALSFGPAISADNHYIAFQSYASNLVAGDTNGTGDIFLHDRYSHATICASVTSGGAPANGSSESPAISADGRYVAFQSCATDLVASDTNSACDIFVYDRQTGTMERVSVATGGAQGNAFSVSPAISADGRYVAFQSAASNLVASDTNNMSDIFVRDRTGGTTVRVSVSGTGTQANDMSDFPAISGDGSCVAFESDASNLVSGDTNGARDIFVYEMAGGAVYRVSQATSGLQPNDYSYKAGISGDGAYVVFQSDATNLVGGDTNGKTDVFLRDRVTRTTHRVSVNGSGVQGNNWSYFIEISGNGRYVCYASDASNLVAGDTNADTDVIATSVIPTYNSIRGDHRYHTAQLISKAMFPGALPPGSGVVLAPGETFQEALCGAPLAAAWGGPVLLTPSIGLENGTKAELLRLQPARVICIGLSPSVVSDVQTAMGVGVTVTSITGANIYEMSRNVANALGGKLGGMSGATAIVTLGTNFPDAIGVAPLACYQLWPVLLTDQPDGSQLNANAAQVLSDWGITKALKAGTYATLPGGVLGVGNLSGLDRYYTNRNVAVWAKANAGLLYTHMAMATGDKFPDALASGPYLAKNRGILLLSPLLGPLPPVIGTEISANAGAVWHVGLIACIEPVIGQVKALLP